MDTLASSVNAYRETLRAAWSDATANPRSRPLPEGRPASFGQCEVASAVLFDQLRLDFPNAHWRLVYGRVLAITESMGQTALARIIPEHIWIDCNSNRPKLLGATVVDVTSDQANDHLLDTVVVETYDSLSDRGILHQPQEFYAGVGQLTESMAQYNSNFADRFRQLQEQFDRLTTL